MFKYGPQKKSSRSMLHIPSDGKQQPADTDKNTETKIVLPPSLIEWLAKINRRWLAAQDDISISGTEEAQPN